MGDLGQREAQAAPVEMTGREIEVIGGDGSVKRVASGVGDGSICICLVHQYLSMA